jgi:hypothetical protein
MEVIFRKCNTIYVQRPGSCCTRDLNIFFIYFILPAFFGSIYSMWAPSYLAQNLVRRHPFSFIFRGIYGFKEV